MQIYNTYSAENIYLPKEIKERNPKTGACFNFLLLSFFNMNNMIKRIIFGYSKCVACFSFIAGSKMMVEAYSLEDLRPTRISSAKSTLSKNSLSLLNLTTYVQSVAGGSSYGELKLALLVSPPEVDTFFVWDAEYEASPQLLVLSKFSAGSELPQDTFYKRMKRSLTESLEFLPLDDVEDEYRNNVIQGRGKNLQFS